MRISSRDKVIPTIYPNRENQHFYGEELSGEEPVTGAVRYCKRTKTPMIIDKNEAIGRSENV
jgi:hypothetical protein